MELPGHKTIGIVNLERIKDEDTRFVFRNLIRQIEELHRIVSLVVNGNNDTLTALSSDVATLTSDVSALDTAVTDLSTMLSDDLALVSYDLSAGTNEGNASAGAWTKRSLNTEVYDPSELVSLSSSVITVQPGVYLVSGGQTFYSDGGTQESFRSRLRNTSDGATVALGENARLHIAAGESAIGWAGLPPTRFSISSAKNFELQYYAQNISSLGPALNTGENERYAWVAFRRLG